MTGLPAATPAVVTHRAGAATLFDAAVYGVEVPVTISASAKRTIRNRALLDAGRHPATRAPLLDSEPPRTCGDCAHHHARNYAKTYHKCDQHRLGETHGEASDIRVSWPACTLFRLRADLWPK